MIHQNYPDIQNFSRLRYKFYKADLFYLCIIYNFSKKDMIISYSSDIYLKFSIPHDLS